jgi:hypothetical protein
MYGKFQHKTFSYYIFLLNVVLTKYNIAYISNMSNENDVIVKYN